MDNVNAENERTVTSMLRVVKIWCGSAEVKKTARGGRLGAWLLRMVMCFRIA